MQPVINAKAVFFQKCLNSALLPGPNFLLDIRVTLLCFGKHAYAIVDDIKQMFLQIGIAMGDRCYLRFHWIDPQGITQVCEFQCWPFGLTSSPSAACWIVCCHAESTKGKFPNAAKAILLNMMMDDVLALVPT
jgi:hypothetical protein